MICDAKLWNLKEEDFNWNVDQAAKIEKNVCIEISDFINNKLLKLSKEEKELVASFGNVVCLGWSGTGKTTSAVLWMFANEFIFWMRYKSLLSTKEKFSASDLETNPGLH